MANSLLYENIKINHHLLKIWEDEFISFNIMDSIIHCNVDQYKRESYTTDLNDSNFENDLNTAIASTIIEKNYINSGCVYSDIDNQQQNPILQLLFAVTNIKSTVSTTDQPTSTTISYYSSSQLVLLNN